MKSRLAQFCFGNPAGLAFLEGSELALMHVNWLPNLADDLYYEFLAYRKSIPNLGTLGGHIIYLNLGEQIRMDEYAQYQGKFTSYMVAGTVSYSALLSRTSSLGLNAKVSYQHLVEMGTAAEKGKGTSTDFGFDIGYLKKEFITPRLDFGLSLSNIGPKVSFIDPDQADPQPTNLTIGFNYALIQSQHNNLNIVYDVDKLLVASYPDMDWDGDGVIGGFDEDGHVSLSGDYSADGKIEIDGQTDNIMKEEKKLRACNITVPNTWDESKDAGNGIPNEGEMINTTDNGAKFGDPDWGIYNEWGQKEVGSADDRTINDELDKLVHNFGMEYWYSTYFALRAGYYYDKTGKIENPTFGVGLRFGGYGFDFGYTSGEPGHPLTNTMRFSLNMVF